ncbi:MAG: DUF402 domain-containing protein [Chloroflexi bacterium]|nr:DUF402 domain-containing protein [Chloroflexota bacterium]MYF22560.1 DUF402 domain-containing protein [Chloroflexota bacterium]
MSVSARCQDLPPAPSETITERKVTLDGRIMEFPLERWLATPELVVGRWVADQDPRAIERYPQANGFTSWGVWWPDKPYSAYRLHRPDGSLRIYRLDTIDQAVFDGERIEFHDLLLDALIRPDGEVSIEDEDEVEEAIAERRLTLEQRWRIEWTRNLFANKSELLMQRIDSAVERAIESVRNGGV